MSDIARPIGVTVIAVLMVLTALGTLIQSVIALFDPQLRAGLGLVSIGLMILTAVIYLLLAKGIFNGSSIARLIVVIFTVLQLLDGIRHLFFEPGLRLFGGLQIIVSLIILGLLFSRKASTFFAAS